MNKKIFYKLLIYKIADKIIKKYNDKSCVKEYMDFIVNVVNSLCQESKSFSFYDIEFEERQQLKKCVMPASFLLDFNLQLQNYVKNRKYDDECCCAYCKHSSIIEMGYPFLDCDLKKESVPNLPICSSYDEREK